MVTILVPPRASGQYLEKMTQIMFETFSVPCLNFVHQATACVAGEGSFSGTYYNIANTTSVSDVMQSIRNDRVILIF